MSSGTNFSMKHPIKRFLVCLSLLLAFLAAGAKENNKDAFAVAIQAAQKKEIFCTATIGCYAVNLTQDRVLGGVNAARSMIPASTLKLLTTAAALETLGRDFRFETIIQYDGKVDEEGTLHGNIYIKGGGDPALGSRNFQDHYYRPHFISTWVQAIQANNRSRFPRPTRRPTPAAPHMRCCAWFGFQRRVSCRIRVACTAW